MLSDPCRLFRVVPVSTFLDHFASDRSHMAGTGKAFPVWPVIKGLRASRSMNLMDYVNMTEAMTVSAAGSSSDSHLGRVYSRDQFISCVIGRS
jgi:hypothetical protein